MPTYIHKTVLLKDLKLTHPLFEILKISFPERYAIEAKHFNYYEKPVVTEDLLVLTHIEAVKAAIEKELESIEVIVAFDFDMDDAVRFINYGLFTKKIKSEPKSWISKISKKLFRKKPKGIEWAETLEGNINEKIGSIIGYDNQTVKFWMRTHRKTLKKLEELAKPKPEPDADIKKESDTGKKDEEADEDKDGADNGEDEASKKEDEKIEPEADIIERLKLSNLTIQLTEKDDGTDDEVPEIFCKGVKLKLSYERHVGPDETDILTYKNREGKNVIKLAINLFRLEEVYNYTQFDEEHFAERRQQRIDMVNSLKNINKPIFQEE